MISNRPDTPITDRNALWMQPGRSGCNRRGASLPGSGIAGRGRPVPPPV